MSTVEKKQTPAERAVAANPNKNGPHNAKAQARLAKKAHQAEQPAYKISVTTRDKDENDGEEKKKIIYSPDEVRAKAKAFLSSPQLSAEERKVLAEILAEK